MTQARIQIHVKILFAFFGILQTVRYLFILSAQLADYTVQGFNLTLQIQYGLNLLLVLIFKFEHTRLKLLDVLARIVVREQPRLRGYGKTQTQQNQGAWLQHVVTLCSRDRYGDFATRLLHHGPQPLAFLRRS